ncbi:MAG: hypothetical protein IPO37_00345 [Saprospiraceae bacterium]|nr:hypothetical protein [Saprospiraceae bacterium]
MKKLVYCIGVFFLLGIFSCVKENKEKVDLKQDDNFEVLKTLEIWSEDNEVGMKVNIVNKDYINLSSRDFKLVYTKNIYKPQQNASNIVKHKEENNTSVDNEPTHFYYELIKGPNVAFGVHMDFLKNSGLRAGNRECTAAIDGRCSGGMRVSGVNIISEDCDHNHFDWDKKTATSNWFWQNLISWTTYTDLSLEYNDPSTSWRLYRVCRDADSYCNLDQLNPWFFILFTPC